MRPSPSGVCNITHIEKACLSYIPPNIYAILMPLSLRGNVIEGKLEGKETYGPMNTLRGALQCPGGDQFK